MNNDLIKKLTVSLKRGGCSSKWRYPDTLKTISVLTNEKSAFDEFALRFYYTPLRVILKNDDMVDKFKCGVEYDPLVGLTFSKRVFLKNLVANVDELLELDEAKAYKEIKKAIRIKKDIYRDVYANGKNSSYYDSILKEFGTIRKKVKFEEYVRLCRQKYTRILNGYVALLEFLSKPIDVTKFINCFNVDQLYLLTCKSILSCTKEKDNAVITNYLELVKDIRKDKRTYNAYITVRGNKYSINDLRNDVA